MQSYNVFCLKSVRGLCCAVPETSAVPRFLKADRWTFDGKLDQAGRVPSGFDGQAAQTGVRFNGFYLFQTTDIRFS
ncbi:hypothetical protein ASG40_19650 [Methylobacterium sp. Leaf399]|uniref:hypothetical protein n=1 Tax=unclassified Methylobacterium TaxID=2615210 RepID=UPI0006F7221F|nr:MULTISPECIES: hypothetical protein [unclassified Methylobacterium]KQP51302.1 hypothetical protein ASF39_09670 [Methylobacterium sp. Leaf108]KQT13802.1 hypothetical protein ASG40_19650 [Methylobacterium sp. Leaf399]KQT77779.1 hypothetical protein ASG59_10605 [Methylobacterium sp. Leaf466]